MQPLRWVVV